MRKLVPVFLILLSVLAVSVQAADGEVLVVSPGGRYTTILAALAAAQAGDTIEVQGGVYPGTLSVEKSVSLIGIDNPVIDGGGEGSIVILSAPDIVFQGFTVRNSGRTLNDEDTGIIAQAPRITVADNQVEDVLFGIYFAAADNGIARNNVVRGYNLDMPLRGDGIRVWYSNGVSLIGNEVYSSRDTLIWFAEDITIADNHFYNNRYGLHFMYSHRAVIEGNTFEYNSVGSYLMYSEDLTFLGNTLAYNRGPSGYGLALKDMDEVVAEDNVFVGNRAGLYIDNSPSRYEGFNIFNGNAFAYNDIGVTMLPAVQRNLFQTNTFLENTQQASARGRGDLQKNVWHQDALGNYWSDYVGYDGDGDGIGEMPYRSEKLFENLMDQYPELRLFLYSPASQAIDFAAAAFPSLRPEPKLVDEAPMTQYTLPGQLTTGAGNGVSGALISASLLLIGLGASVSVFALRFALPRRRRL